MTVWRGWQECQDIPACPSFTALSHCGTCEWGGKLRSTNMKVCSVWVQVSWITLILHLIYVRYMHLVLWGDLLSLQPSQHAGLITVILSGASVCILLLAEHTWGFKASYVVVFLGGMVPAIIGFSWLESKYYFYVFNIDSALICSFSIYSLSKDTPDLMPRNDRLTLTNFYLLFLSTVLFIMNSCISFHQWVKTVSHNSFCILDSSVHHVSA